MSETSYVPPNKPIEDYTAVERRAWLDNHFATADERKRQSDCFYGVAKVSLLAAFVAPMLFLLVALMFRSVSS